MQLLNRVLIFIMVLGFLACQEETIHPDVFGSLYGEVLTESENLAIEGATISTNPPTSIVVSDSLGRFALENIKTGTYSIRAEKDDFAPQIASISIFEDQTSTIEIKMSPDTETNLPPNSPILISPEESSINQSVNVTLSWEASDPDESDELRFEVLLFNPTLGFNTTVAKDLLETELELTDLNYGTTYFWQVIVSDGTANPVNGEVWSFSTEPFPDHRFLFVKEQNGKYDIFSAQVAFDEFQLTSNAGSNWRPIMSPDRNKIAYISNIGIEAQLFVMNRDGSNVQQVTNSIPISGFNPFELDFCWSPNSEQLLYMSLNKLYRINIDGSGLSLIAEAPLNETFTECDWTQVGNKIIARTTGLNPYNSKIYLYQANGEFIEEVMTDLPGSFGGGNFSIDGQYMLFTHDVSEFESPDGRQLDSRIFLMKLADHTVKDLSEYKPAGTNDLDPRFSPDGSKVIFTNTNNDGISPKDVWAMNLGGEGRTLFFEDAEMPEWR